MITLKNLAEATAQQVFDQVATHLLKQGAPSRDDGGLCAYRGENGLSCAAGSLIADDEYNPDMEGLSWSGLMYRPKFDVPCEHLDLIQDLQKIHDNDHPGDWANRLVMAAADFGISDEVVKPYLVRS